jgi:hypothetical protein
LFSSWPSCVTTYEHAYLTNFPWNLREENGNNLNNIIEYIININIINNIITQ